MWENGAGKGQCSLFTATADHCTFQSRAFLSVWASSSGAHGVHWVSVSPQVYLVRTFFITATMTAKHNASAAAIRVNGIHVSESQLSESRASTTDWLPRGWRCWSTQSLTAAAVAETTTAPIRAPMMATCYGRRALSLSQSALEQLATVFSVKVQVCLCNWHTQSFVFSPIMLLSSDCSCLLTFNFCWYLPLFDFVHSTLNSAGSQMKRQLIGLMQKSESVSSRNVLMLSCAYGQKGFSTHWVLATIEGDCDRSAFMATLASDNMQIDMAFAFYLATTAIIIATLCIPTWMLGLI